MPNDRDVQEKSKPRQCQSVRWGLMQCELAAGHQEHYHEFTYKRADGRVVKYQWGDLMPQEQAKMRIEFEEWRGQVSSE
jgi:hypothetical protein